MLVGGVFALVLGGDKVAPIVAVVATTIMVLVFRKHFKKVMKK